MDRLDTLPNLAHSLDGAQRVCLHFGHHRRAAMRGVSPLRTMPCDCTNYPPIELDPQSISRRIKQSPQIRKRLTQIAENPELRLYLFRCPACGQFWQSGHEWNFADREYLFHVPPIEVTDWQRGAVVVGPRAFCRIQAQRTALCRTLALHRMAALRCRSAIRKPVAGGHR